MTKNNSYSMILSFNYIGYQIFKCNKVHKYLKIIYYEELAYEYNKFIYNRIYQFLVLNSNKATV